MLLDKLIIISLIAGLVLPSFCLAQEEAPQMPQTMTEAKGWGMKILTALPDATKKVWQEEAWPFILQMWNWAKDVWDTYIGYRVEAWWNQLLELVGKEPTDLKGEFQKEKTEMQKDAWQRFKDLLD